MNPPNVMAGSETATRTVRIGQSESIGVLPRVLIRQRDVVPYLLSQAIVSIDSVVTGDLVLIDVSRRNRNFQVITEHEGSYLLKQGMTFDGIQTVAHEADVYQFFQSHSELRGFRRYLPSCIGYDESAGILILSLISHAKDFRQYHAASGRFSVKLAGELGTALGNLHSRTASIVQSGAILPFASSPPWVLSSHRPTIDLLSESSQGALQVHAMVQYSSELGLLLDQLRHDWFASSVIHHDIKWDNCLAYARPGSKRRSRLAIVDWEAASIGDPCWDTGSVFNDYFSFWVLSIPMMADTPLARLPELSKYPLYSMHPALTSFWQAYAVARGLDREASQTQLVQSVRYAGARLIQTAFEQVQMASEITGNIVGLVQLAENILARPQEAATQLLGITP